MIMQLGWIVIIVAIGAALLLALSLARLRRRRFLSCGASGAGALLLFVIALGLGALAAALHTFERLTYEQPVAHLEFKRLAAEAYTATLTLPSGQTRYYHIDGDQWQLDARVIKWRGLANLLGFDTEYRLERLSGRYRELEQARRGPRTVYSLARSTGLDLWDWLQRHHGWLPWIDARYGSAAYLPMADRASFEVRLTQSGLIARPVNESATRAVERWH